MADYVLEHYNKPGRFKGTFEEVKAKLSEMTEKDMEITNSEWEKIQLLEPEHLPFKVGLFLMYEVKA